MTVKKKAMTTKEAKTVVTNDEYTGKTIKELPYPECVRQRPALYIGNNDLQGLVVCIREIVNNSVDEFLAGFCTHITVTRKDTYTFAIMDNGRGVPFDQVDGKNSLTRIFGTLHAGRNFVEKTVFSTGINGCGSSITNAMSTDFSVTSRRGLQYGKIDFKLGIEKDLKIGKTKTAVNKAPFDKSSTLVEFTLDPSVFTLEGEELTHDVVFDLLRETAFLNNGLTLEYRDETTGFKQKLYHTDGVTDYLKRAIADTKPLFKNPISLGQDTIKDTKIEVAFSYDTSFSSDKITSFTNTIRTSEGGTHVTGFKRALTQKIIAYVTANKLCKEKVTNDDVYVGLNAIVSVFVFNPKYTSQTKQCLKNTEVMGHVVTFTNNALDEWLNTNPVEIKAIAAKIDLVAKARIAQKRALDNIKKDSSNALASLSNIAKFSDCEEQMTGRTEIFFVEG